MKNLNNREYGDGIKSIGDKIGIMRDVYLSVHYCSNNTSPILPPCGIIKHNLCKALVAI